MKPRFGYLVMTSLFMAVAFAAGTPAWTGGTPVGTAFTYQGQLKESGQPASGQYDFQVCLFDSVSEARRHCVPPVRRGRASARCPRLSPIG